MSGVTVFPKHIPLVQTWSQTFLYRGTACRRYMTARSYGTKTPIASLPRYPVPRENTAGFTQAIYPRAKVQSVIKKKSDLIPRHYSTASESLVRTDRSLTLDPIILRDSCTCLRCVDQSTRQREFTFSDIPQDIKAVPSRKREDGAWEVKWHNDIPGFENHVSTFSPKHVMDLSSPQKHSYSDLTPQRPWTKRDYVPEKNTYMFDDFMQSDHRFLSALRSLQRTGLVFIQGVPPEIESVGRLAERVAPLRTTFYGPTWDVRSVVDSKNVAYTSKYLGFHMDLLYMDQPPSYQLLHCIQNSCAGGESRFVDTYKALDLVTSNNAGFLDALATAKVTFHYDNNGHYYRRQKSILDLQEKPIEGASFEDVDNEALFHNLAGINWSPPFMAGLDQEISWKKRREFLQAAKAFAELLESSELVYETKMEEDTCVIFDNQRVCHARNAFDVKDGRRWLRGAYLDRCDFTSTLTTLARAQNATHKHRHDGNSKL